MSHVEIPTVDLLPRLTPPAQGKQTEEQAFPEDFEDVLGQRSTGTEFQRSQGGSLRTGTPLHGLMAEHRAYDHHHQSSMSRSIKANPDKAALRQTIESQFSLEILLKHKELRLIDQEIAKCQVALEQLRRCQVIPYPALSSAYDDMHAVSTGSGLALNNLAPHAPPYGVVNGPYARHYGRWLIPDSAFEDADVESQTTLVAGKMLPERTTRATQAEKGPTAGIPRPQRGSKNTRLKALPHGYPEPKEEKGPMIVKRSSDGHMVKLVCLDCRRWNFNSTQGFINHCRIGHARQFLSHDAAIEASGEAVEMDAEGGAGESNGTPTTASAGLVHPLIRSAHHLSVETTASPSTRKKAQPKAPTVRQSPSPHSNLAVSSTPARSSGDISGTDNTPHKAFIPSPQTPHLSALLAKLGTGGDLEDMVSEAKTKPEIDLYEVSEDDDDGEVAELAPGQGDARSRSTRGVVLGGHSPALANKSNAPLDVRTTSDGVNEGTHKPKGLHGTAGHPAYPSPYSMRDHHEDHGTSMIDITTPLNLSPNTTDLHPAPSLVSDDGDYDNTHSDTESQQSDGADEEEHHYVDAEVVDHDEMELGESSGLRLAPTSKPHGPAGARRSRAATAIRGGGPEDRHVSFASPTTRRRPSSRAKEAP